MIRKHPSFYSRITSVWYRHFRVYTKNLLANGFPPFLEPLIFLAAVGIGLGRFINEMDGISYLPFLASGLMVTTAMYTSAFECSYGTFIRLEFDKAYDGMLAAPLSTADIFLGEILWAGTKGFFFSTAVLVVVSVFGILSLRECFLVPTAGFLTGLMFGSLSLFITSFVNDINQFNFYFTGILSPMFFFSGAVFSIDEMPSFLRLAAEALPLTHSVRLVRSICFGSDYPLLQPLLFITVFTTAAIWLSVRRLKRRLIF